MDCFGKILIAAGILTSPYLMAGNDGVDYAILAEALGAIHRTFKEAQVMKEQRGDDDDWRQWCDAIERVKASKNDVARRNSAVGLRSIVDARLFMNGIDDVQHD